MIRRICSVTIILILVVLAGCTGGGDKIEQGNNLKGKILDQETGNKVLESVIIDLAGHESLLVKAGEYQFTGVAAGKKTIGAKAEGYRPYSKTITIQANVDNIHDIILEPEPKPPSRGALTGSIFVSNSQELITKNVQVKLGELEANFSDGVYSFPDLAPGDYELTVRAAGYKDFSELVTIAAGEELLKNVPLVQITTTIDLKIMVLEADVFLQILDGVTVTLDNEPAQQVEGYFWFYGVTLGEHTLKVTSDGWFDYEELFTVEAEVNSKVVYFKKRPDPPDIHEVLVPGGTGFPMGEGDPVNYTGYIEPFYMSIYLVTDRLWKQVGIWAYHEAGYDFRCSGNNVFMKPQYDLHPVVYNCWVNAMVWCNALTEYYNVAHGADLQPVYLTPVTREPLRTAVKNYSTDPFVAPDANGFRLPSVAEWELAARYQNGSSWTPWNFVSGDIEGPTFGEGKSTRFGDYAVYEDNSNDRTGEVGSKLPNQLGIYDMSGNTWEFCFDQDLALPTHRLAKGGSFVTDARLIGVGFTLQVVAVNPICGSRNTGFRFVRSQ